VRRGPIYLWSQILSLHATHLTNKLRPWQSRAEHFKGNQRLKECRNKLRKPGPRSVNVAELSTILFGIGNLLPPFAGNTSGVRQSETLNALSLLHSATICAHDAPIGESGLAQYWTRGLQIIHFANADVANVVASRRFPAIQHEFLENQKSYELLTLYSNVVPIKKESVSHISPQAPFSLPLCFQPQPKHNAW